VALGTRRETIFSPSDRRVCACHNTRKTPLFVSFAFFSMEGNTTPQLFYHITSDQLWASAQKDGVYTHPLLEKDGFIHGSTDVPVKSRLTEGKVHKSVSLPFPPPTK